MSTETRQDALKRFRAAYAAFLSEAEEISTLFQNDIQAKIEGPEAKIAAIINIVCDAYCLTFEQVIGDGRTAHVTECRHIAMLISRESLGCSYELIGAVFGDRDHSGVLLAVRNLRQEIIISEKKNQRVHAMRKLVRQILNLAA